MHIKLSMVSVLICLGQSNLGMTHAPFYDACAYKGDNDKDYWHSCADATPKIMSDWSINFPISNVWGGLAVGTAYLCAKQLCTKNASLPKKILMGAGFAASFMTLLLLHAGKGHTSVAPLLYSYLVGGVLVGMGEGVWMIGDYISEKIANYWEEDWEKSNDTPKSNNNNDTLKTTIKNKPKLTQNKKNIIKNNFNKKANLLNSSQKPSLPNLKKSLNQTYQKKEMPNSIQTNAHKIQNSMNGPGINKSCIKNNTIKYSVVKNNTPNDATKKIPLPRKRKNLNLDMP